MKLNLTNYILKKKKNNELLRKLIIELHAIPSLNRVFRQSSECRSREDHMIDK